MNTTLRDLPVFGICGHSGAGKTTLIEALVGRLRERDLSVAVVKFHAHGIDVDREGKDSDRFFRAGADVFLHGPDQGFVRTQPIESTGQRRTLWELVRRYDVILVEGCKRIECEKVWLLGEGETSAPPEAGDVIATLPRDANRIETVRTILEDWLTRVWLKPPVY